MPARNTIFLSIALGFAESLAIDDIFIGGSKADRDGYPDCRAEYFEAFSTLASLATGRGVEGHQLTLHTPLIDKSKAQIITLGQSLAIDYGKTITCYQVTEQGAACGRCQACRLRQEGFAKAGVPDPTLYRNLC